MSDEITLSEFKGFFEGVVYTKSKQSNYDQTWKDVLTILRRVKPDKSCPKFDPSCG